MRRFTPGLLVGLMLAVGACSEDAATPSPSPTQTEGTTRAAFVAEYERACVAAGTVAADLEQPADDGGTFPPSPSEESLPAWAEWARGLEDARAGLVEDLQAIAAPEDEAVAEKSAELIALREADVEVLATMGASAEAGDSQAFSAAFSDWVASGTEVGQAEGDFGIRCDA